MHKRQRALMKWVGGLLTVVSVAGVVAIVVVLWPMLVHLPKANVAAKAIAATPVIGTRP